MSFFGELKRRNVVRVGIAYVVIGWLLAQVAELAFEAFAAPDWVLKTVLFVLLLGLPLALFFAWVFELTPEGIKLERDVDRSKSITPRTGRKLDLIIIAVLVVAVSFLLVDKFLINKSQAPASEIIATVSPSIAVLPFVNMSGDNDYFADGLSEELLNLLAQIPDLKVAGRTSSFVFKGKNEDLREVGNALGVTTVLEGSVRRSGERLRVTAQLINVADGFHVWSETYDRKMADIFDIQDDVAGAIANALKTHLVPEVNRPTQNAEAYSLYLEAVALQTYTNGDDIILAQELLDKAIALDPRFAKAYELKSNFYWLQAGWQLDAPAAQKLAYAAATKALELDPTLAGARSYASTASPDWSWTLEFDALEELIRVEPNNISALEALAYDMVLAGYFQEAVKLTQRIIELEPLATLGYFRKGEALIAAGRLDEAHTSLRHVAEMGDSGGLWTLGADFMISGDDESAIHWLEKLNAADGQDPDWVRPFIERVRDPKSGKAYLDRWVEEQVASATNVNERRRPYAWYLLLLQIDDYWRALEALAAGEGAGWTNADTLEYAGMVFRRAGYAKHPKYIPWAKRNSLIDLWDERGPPDHCRKTDGAWVCE